MHRGGISPLTMEATGIFFVHRLAVNEDAAVKAESCGDCGTYLKILYQEKDPKVEAVADDLASLILDAKMEQEGFARSSINPFLFPGEGE